MNMRLYFFLLFLLISQAAESVLAQSKLRAELDTARISVGFKHYPKVVRYNNTWVEMTGPGSYVVTNEWAETVLKQDPEPLQNYEFYSKTVKIDDMQAYVYDAKGNLVRRVSMGDAFDRKAMSGIQFYDDSRLKIHAVSHSSYPYTVVFYSKVEHKSTFQYPTWSPRMGDLPVLESRFEVKHPTLLPVKYTCMNGAPEPTKAQQGNLSVLTWSQSKMSPREPKLAAPKGINAEAHVRLMQPEFDYEGYKGSSTDWKAFGAFLYSLFDSRQDLPADELARVRELTAAAKTQREKAALAYRYLQNNTRYVAILFGIGGFQPMTPQEVKTNGYGECKALSNYLVAMLRALEIPAYHAIVFADPDYRRVPQLSTSYPESRANHCIAMAVLDGDSTWFECTSDELTPGDLSSFTENRLVLLLTPQGGQLVSTPTATAVKNRTTTIAQAKLDAEGSLELDYRRRLRGYANSDARQLLNHAPSTEWEKWLRESTPLPNFELKQVDYGNYTKPDTALSITMSARVPQYVTKAGNRWLVKPGLLNRPTTALPEDSSRTEPVWLRMPLTEEDQVTLELPQGYRLNRSPDPVVIEGPCGRYLSSVSYDHERHVVTYRRTFIIDRFKLPAATYNQVREFFLKVSKADDAKLVLVKGT